jgi:zinc transporter ZupT
MKSIISKLINVAPVILGLVIAAYVIEEIIEDYVSETFSDFVYPIAALVILYILWLKVIPEVRKYLESEN